MLVSILLYVLLKTSAVLGVNLPNQHSEITSREGSYVNHFTPLMGDSSTDFQHSFSRQEAPLCDPTVKQHSGYIDIPGGKHLFFWFFEARHDPMNTPLMLWSNGGPGCSSTTGLLRELGPCMIAANGTSTKWNPHSWTEVANMIFIDQPIAAGFSYLDANATRAETSEEIAEDIYLFLQGWFARFPEYSKLPFHLAGESWAGHMLPETAALIVARNEASQMLGYTHINLHSLILGNTLTGPLHTMTTVPRYICEGPYALLKAGSRACQEFEAKAEKCKVLAQACYDRDDEKTCFVAHDFCWSWEGAPHEVEVSGRNPYNMGQMCNEERNGPHCYVQASWIETYLNLPSTKRGLGIPMSRNFQACDAKISEATIARGQWMRDSSRLLPGLIGAGVRVLVYNGNADFVCNYMGSEAYMDALETPFSAEFRQARPRNWTVPGSDRIAGYVRSAGGAGKSAGLQTFVNVHEAGHYVPWDQPEPSLFLIRTWVANLPLV